MAIDLEHAFGDGWRALGAVDQDRLLAYVAALAEALEGVDFTRFDIYVGVSSGGFIAAAFAVRILFSIGKLLGDFVQFLLGIAFVSACGVVGIHICQLLRVTDAVGHAVFTKRSGSFSHLVGRALLFLSHAARGLINVAFQTSNFVGQIVLLFS